MVRELFGRSIRWAVMAKGEGKTRREYMLKLLGERLTGEPSDSYTNQHMERGKLMEGLASARREPLK